MFKILLFLLLNSVSQASTTIASIENNSITVAVIDSGFGYKHLGHEAKLCQAGHKDFSIDQKFTNEFNTLDSIPIDLHAHGTNIVGLIHENAKNSNYCVIVIKYYSEKSTNKERVESYMKSVQYAVSLNPTLINISGGGPDKDDRETIAIKSYLNSGGIVISAAGNESSNIDEEKNAYYPASLDQRIIVVGNGINESHKSSSSNYGKIVDVWEDGNFKQGFNISMSGTSQATAIVTGKYIKNMGK